jgi:hypothetical protein
MTLRNAFSTALVISAIALSGAAAEARTGIWPGGASPTTADDLAYRLETEGYQQLSNVQKAADGGWTADAVRHNHRVHVSVTGTGGVIERR